MAKRNGISLVTAGKVYEIFSKEMEEFLKDKKDIPIENVMTIKFEKREPKLKELFGSGVKIKTKETKCNILVSKKIKDLWT
jgi:nucleoid DNA-binding protein